MEELPTDTALAAFRSYTRAFQSLDPKWVARFFHEPALMVTPKGIEALPDAAAVERAYGRIMAELPAQRYARTDFTRIEERRLGDDLSEITGGGTWVDVAGRTFMPFGMTYTMRRGPSGWRIVTALIHGADPR
jgi:hypothetical protein